MYSYFVFFRHLAKMSLKSHIFDSNGLTSLKLSMSCRNGWFLWKTVKIHQFLSISAFLAYLVSKTWFFHCLKSLKGQFLASQILHRTSRGHIAMDMKFGTKSSDVPIFDISVILRGFPLTTLTPWRKSFLVSIQVVL